MPDPQLDKQISNEQVTAIGALVVAMSRVDSLLTELIRRIMGCNAFVGLIAVHHQQPASKIDTLRALMNLAFKGELEFEPLFEPLDTAKRLFDSRNTIVHCLWAIDEDGTPLAVRFSARGKLNRTRNPYDVPKILALLREAHELEETLANLRDRIIEALRSDHQS